MKEFVAPHENQTDNIIDTLYNSVNTPHAWGPVMEEISTLIGASGSAFLLTPPPQTVGNISTGVIEKHNSDYFLGEFNVKDIRDQRVSRMQVPRFVVDEDVVSPHEFEHHPVFTDFFRKVPAGRQAAANFNPSSSERTSIIFGRDHRLGAFEQPALEWLNGLHPHFQRVMSNLARNEQSRMRSIVSAMESFGVPAAFLTFSSRIHVSNRHFGDIIADVLGVEGDSLVYGTTAQGLKLKEAIQAYEMKYIMKSPVLPSMSMPMKGRRTGKNYILHLMRNVEGPQSMSVALRSIITEVGTLNPLPADLITSLFGLTGAEAMVASDIGGGSSVAEISLRRRISENTVRSYVKSIFSKLEVNRQIDLVRMLQNRYLLVDRSK